jgi:hypothetical protein
MVRGVVREVGGEVEDEAVGMGIGVVAEPVGGVGVLVSTTLVGVVVVAVAVDAVVVAVLVVDEVALVVVVVVVLVVVVPVVHTFCGRVWLVRAGSCRPTQGQSFVELGSSQRSISVRVSSPPHGVWLLHSPHSNV